MTHEYKRKVNYYETDQMCIVHHSNYIRWLEEARIDFMEHIGFSLAQLESLDVQIPVLEVECKYLRAVKFGEEVTVVTKMTEFTGVRMNFEYQIILPDSTVCNTASSKHCFIKPQGSAINLKKVLPRVYEIFESCLDK